VRKPLSFEPKGLLTRLLAGRGVSAGLVLLSLCVLAVVWYFTVIRIDNEKQLAIEGSIADSRNVAAIVSANLDEVLGKTLLYARIGQSMLTKAAGRPWWQASMLLATLAVNWDVYIAVARDRGLGDPSDWPVDELCAWVYLRMTQYAKEEDRARIDADLTTPPGILTPTRTPSTPRTAAGRSSARRWPVSAWGVPEQVWSDPPGYLGHALLVADRVPSLPNERPGR